MIEFYALRTDKGIVPEMAMDRVRALFSYDAENGILIWRVRPLADFATQRACSTWNTRFSGKPAGYIDEKGYYIVVIDNRKYRGHRVIWLYVHGVWPVEVDHEFGKTADNRMERLRNVTHAENGRNTKLRSDNRSGVMGVHWCSHTNRWRVRVVVDGKHIHVGRFDSFTEAAAARHAASGAHGFHPNHGRTVNG